jgi:uncharacterized protein YdeI (YjbR/CyaY-like superfamily)
MGKRNPKVDAYIEEAAEFARPILRHLREAVHEACPDAEEAIKWNVPFFVHRANLCYMAAFKAHCAFGFWNSRAVMGDGARDDEKGAGQFGRITSIAELPPRPTLISFVRKAADLSAAGVKPARSPRPPPPIPKELRTVLKKHPKAASEFDTLTPSHRREIIEWVAGAKQAETRLRRADQAIERILSHLTSAKPKKTR